MIDDRLKELGEFAEDLEKEDPLDILNYHFNKITEEIDNIPEFQKKMGENFGNVLVENIEKYTTEEIAPTLISFHLMDILVRYIKKTMIEEKASSLGIEKKLYKKEMKFLFKGK
jgi:hypothetical protein